MITVVPVGGVLLAQFSMPGDPETIVLKVLDADDVPQAIGSIDRSQVAGTFNISIPIPSDATVGRWCYRVETTNPQRAAERPFSVVRKRWTPTLLAS
jgi:hypothetical protein